MKKVDSVQYEIEAREKSRHNRKWMVSDQNIPASSKEFAEWLCDMWTTTNPQFEYRVVVMEVHEISRGNWIGEQAQ